MVEESWKVPLQLNVSDVSVLLTKEKGCGITEKIKYLKLIKKKIQIDKIGFWLVQGVFTVYLELFWFLS